jgi:hypothetical protein
MELERRRQKARRATWNLPIALQCIAVVVQVKHIHIKFCLLIFTSFSAWYPRVALGTGAWLMSMVVFYQKSSELLRKSWNNLLSCDAIHSRQQPTELEYNHLIPKYTGRNSPGTMRDNNSVLILLGTVSVVIISSNCSGKVGTSC